MTDLAARAVHLKVECEPRYWEDAKIDGVEDADGKLMPFLCGAIWAPVIHLETGRIVDWPDGVTAWIHYKVCDAGRYALLDAEGAEIAVNDGYVPRILRPGGGGGDYIIMRVDGAGFIENWKADLEDFLD